MSAELIKTVKQYSFPLSDEEMNLLERTGKSFRNCRNYFFSRFYGIKSITKLENGRKLRDSLMKENLANISRMPARYWKIALVQVLGNLKTLLENVVAIDKGRRKLVTSISGNSYGTGYSGLAKDLIEKQERKMKERQFYWNLYRNFLNSEKTLKAENVLANNLGKKKFNKFSERIREKSRSYINHELDLFFETEKPTEIIKEDLTWENLNGKSKGKSFNRIINRWEKGYLDDQIEWKAQQRGIRIINVNPAYTSQICHICDSFGKREGEKFACPHCENKMDADVNAAHNIMKRKEIKEINIYTSASKVKEHYLKLNN